MSSMNPPPVPPATPQTIEDRVKTARQNLEKSFKEYHKLLSDKVLDTNKTEAQKNFEKKTVDDLQRACVALDNINVGEGMLSMSIISLREILKMRDRVNELEFELLKTKRDLLQLRKDSGDKNVKEG